MGAHGLRGELLCRVITDFPERFESTIDLLIGEPPEPRRVERQRNKRGQLILKLAGIDDRTAAEHYRGALLQVPIARAVSLPEGSFFWHEIIGLRVEDTAGQHVGEITEVLATGSNDVYIVKTARGELLLPAIRDVVREIDVQRSLMVVDLIPGLES